MVESQAPEVVYRSSLQLYQFSVCSKVVLGTWQALNKYVLTGMSCETLYCHSQRTRRPPWSLEGPGATPSNNQSSLHHVLSHYNLSIGSVG